MTSLFVSPAVDENPDLAGESSLTPQQREILTELTKVLLTVQQLNEKLVKAIAATGEDMQAEFKQGNEKGVEVFKPVVQKMKEERRSGGGA